MPSRKPTELVKVNLRLRESLRQRLEREAKRNNASLNSEMTRRLERSFERDAEVKMVLRRVDKAMSSVEDSLRSGVKAIIGLARRSGVPKEKIELLRQRSGLSDEEWEAEVAKIDAKLAAADTGRTQQKPPPPAITKGKDK